ncbi:MAG TPA: hypothetical protein VL326_08595 [Kofleriaceae bacterium]|nr:hypothetical protein [Kofleriaceae bacterium]
MRSLVPLAGMMIAAHVVVRFAIVIAIGGCVGGGDLVQTPPCSARIYACDAAVVLDETEHGCLAVPRGAWVDADPQTPGTQYDCSVSDVQRYGEADQAEQILPACDVMESNAPCWRVVPDATCPEEPAALEVVRAGIPPPVDNQVSAYCLYGCACSIFGGS